MAVLEIRLLDISSFNFLQLNWTNSKSFCWRKTNKGFKKQRWQKYFSFWKIDYENKRNSERSSFVSIRQTNKILTNSINGLKFCFFFSDMKNIFQFGRIFSFAFPRRKDFIRLHFPIAFSFEFIRSFGRLAHQTWTSLPNSRQTNRNRIHCRIQNDKKERKLLPQFLPVCVFRLKKVSLAFVYRLADLISVA